MGWARCGHDSRGRPIGYAHSARCDHPGCKAKIDRGLSYACGGMHGTSDGCEDYFCGDHMTHAYDPCAGESKQFCLGCAGELDRQKMSDLLQALVEAVTDPNASALAIRRDLTTVLVQWDEADEVPVERDLFEAEHVFNQHREKVARRAEVQASMKAFWDARIETPEVSLGDRH